jgi:hypothetical protein
MMPPLNTLGEIEKVLATPQFLGVSLGPTLNDFLVAYLDGRLIPARVRSFLVNPIRAWKFRRRPYGKRRRDGLPAGRVLVTWSSAKFHNSQLIKPIVDQLGYENCLVLAAKPNVAASLPEGLESIVWEDALGCDEKRWRGEFDAVWPALSRQLRRACRAHRLPRAVSADLSLSLMLASQYVAGCEDFLATSRPAAVLVDYDRNRLWSALVLAARRMRIPTHTLVHGVLGEEGIGYVPVVADKVFCWGEIDRRKFLAAGTESARVVVAGCPRLRRGLTADRRQARLKASVAIEKPVALLATAPYAMEERLRLAGVFCAGMERVSGAVGAVRLHPMEDIKSYASLIAKHPSIHFLTNAQLSVDEAIAAADAVVVHSSGFGSDALTKGCPVIVLDVLEQPLGHGAELIRYAECPGPQGEEAFATAIRSLLFDPVVRDKAVRAARNYTELFCAAFGDDAARNIAQALLEARVEASDNGTAGHGSRAAR